MHVSKVGDLSRPGGALQTASLPPMANVMSFLQMLCKVSFVLFCTVLATACGGRPEQPIGFVNQTSHTDAQLWSLWKTAQQNLSQQIDLNPLQQIFQDTPADIRPGDPRVWNVSPRQVRVAPQPDVASGVIYAATGELRPDPTGLIACPQPCNVHYSAAYSIFQKPTTLYAASWEPSESNFDYLIIYEFENQILSALGYDMRWR